jgi:NAD(P)-dependent dehydrogenase (short-subunit alcohol dehydrogenase family)
MDLGIKDKLALVTGSTAGIGYAIAKGLLEEGAKVVINGRTRQRVDEAVAKLKSAGNVFGAAGDMSTAAAAAQVVARVNAIGPLDILVNNVGYFEVKALAELEDADWEAMFQLNVMSSVRMSKAFLPGMLQRNWGRIVFIASEQSAKPNPVMLHYAMSKAAQVSIARGLAESTRNTGVTVNSVLAAATWSEGVEGFINKMAQCQGVAVETMKADYFRGEAHNSLLQRFATTKEIADQVIFLCSANASAINGAAQRVDGGVIRSML